MDKQSIDVRNIGFVNCEWILKGKLKKNEESKVYCEGRTYDGKLYTFKETDYKRAFESLQVLTKPLKEGRIINNSEVGGTSILESSEQEERKEVVERRQVGCQRMCCEEEGQQCVLF